MVAFDYSKEPNNPWNAADWNPKAQIDFMRRVRAANKYDGTAEARISQRIAQSDTKGIPPKIVRPVAPLVIVQKRFLGSQTVAPTTPPAPPPVLGFGQSGVMEASQQYTLAVAPFKMYLPGIVPSEARCDIAPTSDAILQLVQSDPGILCSILFAAGTRVGIFSWTSPVSEIDPGDVLLVIAPPVADPTLSGVNIAFVGSLVAP